MTNTTHTPNTAINAHIDEVRAAGTKTTKAACGRRIASNKMVAASNATCEGCHRQLAADAAQAARLAR